VVGRLDDRPRVAVGIRVAAVERRVPVNEYIAGLAFTTRPGSPGTPAALYCRQLN